MHSSCAQVKSKWRVYSQIQGTVAVWRYTTEAKMTTVASAMKVAISHSSRWSRNRLNMMGVPPACGDSAAGAARALLLRALRDDLLYRLEVVLADHVLVLLIERQHGLAPDRFLRRRQDVDLGGFRGPDFLQRVIVFLLRDGALVLARVVHCPGERVADIGGQAFPEFLVDDDRVHDHAVVGQRHVLLHLVHFLRVLVGDAVLFAVHHALLQRRV